jgi:hypothetical protein
VFFQLQLPDEEPTHEDGRLFGWNLEYGRPGKEGNFMPAKSKKQQMAAGAALAAKRGERSRSELKGASRQMVKSMSERELERMASAKRKKLPTRSRKK